YIPEHTNGSCRGNTYGWGSMQSHLAVLPHRCKPHPEPTFLTCSCALNPPRISSFTPNPSSPAPFQSLHAPQLEPPYPNPSPVPPPAP
uniref:Uncharacterized protein n=1 Tax=Chelonoidis abingdonii TaxID=106734 RepID=A0A8C0ILC2_CHEAB